MKSTASMFELAATENKIGTGSVPIAADADEFWTIARIVVSGASGALTVTIGSTVVLNVDITGFADLDFHASPLHNNYTKNEAVAVACSGAKLNVRYR